MEPGLTLPRVLMRPLSPDPCPLSSISQWTAWIPHARAEVFVCEASATALWAGEALTARPPEPHAWTSAQATEPSSQTRDSAAVTPAGPAMTVPLVRAKNQGWERRLSHQLCPVSSASWLSLFLSHIAVSFLSTSHSFPWPRTWSCSALQWREDSRSVSPWPFYHSDNYAWVREEWLTDTCIFHTQIDFPRGRTFGTTCWGEERQIWDSTTNTGVLSIPQKKGQTQCGNWG